ncbi:hypothetical protein MSAN_02293700 [Mycena sanguinolenta]|uniref:Uncharacterized protein n=1 Tax=Mycena sanguinolenta TaxID=230812 RepID=A0A8H6X8L7_9AGAR|nr:hypothetical protein MSAN_02293700 [Mycena sanguinolenta]
MPVGEIPMDVFMCIAAIAHPDTWLALAQLNQATRAEALDLQYRALCVSAGPMDTLTKDGVGFPCMDPLTFGHLLEQENHPIARVRHLLFSAWVMSFDGVFERCTGLVSLWIDDDGGGASSAALRALEALPLLRELTLPVRWRLNGVSLRAVTHLFLCGVEKLVCEWEPATLSTFPSLTHVGFSCEPQSSAMEAALAFSDTLRVLVRGRRRQGPASPRLVHLSWTIMDPYVDWLLRFVPGWMPAWACARGLRRSWDQWTLCDAIVSARERGELQAEQGELSNDVLDHPELVAGVRGERK